MDTIEDTIHSCMAQPDAGRKAAYFTLGCKLNFSETSTIARMLKARGVERIGEGETPDICVVNTCSVTEMADKKGRSLIRRISRRWPDATLVVTGCYAQLKPEEVASFEGVDIVLGSKEKLRIAEYLEEWSRTHTPVQDTTRPTEIREFAPSCERGDRTRYFLKVQDGCDYYCTYCTIPFARGRSRSGSIKQIVAQAEQAAHEGGKEIVLTGVNVGEFGADTGETFFDLLRALDRVDGIERFRISSIEPNLLTEEIIHWIATESRAFMPHFHIPLQAGSDKVLKIMNRRYGTALFRSRIEYIRHLIPDAFIGVDVIAGARGEDEEEWHQSLEFIRSLPVTRLHVFPYSERPGTAALKIAGEVAQRVKHERVAILSEISDAKLHEYLKAHIGEEKDVLWEHLIGHTGQMSGLTDNYIRIAAPADDTLLNRVSKIKITGFDPDHKESMTGEHL